MDQVRIPDRIVIVPEFLFELKLQEIVVFYKGSKIEILSSKVTPKETQSDRSGPFFEALGHSYGHFGIPVAFQSPLKQF